MGVDVEYMSAASNGGFNQNANTLIFTFFLQTQMLGLGWEGSKYKTVIYRSNRGLTVPVGNISKSVLGHWFISRFQINWLL